MKIIKRKITLLSLILAAVLVLFVCCRKDKYYEEDIIGSWKTSTWSYIFHEDHSGSRTQGFVTQKYTWSLSDDELELRITEYEEEGSTQSLSLYVTFVLESLSGSRMEAYEKNDPTKSIITFTK